MFLPGKSAKFPSGLPSCFHKPTLGRHIFENANTSIGNGIDYRIRHFLAANVGFVADSAQKTLRIQICP